MQLRNLDKKKSQRIRDAEIYRASDKKKRRSVGLWIYRILVILGILFIAGYIIWSRQRIVAIGYVDSPTYQLGSSVTGTITELRIEEGDSVQTGERLSTISHTPAATLPDGITMEQLNPRPTRQSLEKLYLTEARTRVATAEENYQQMQRLFQLDAVVAGEVRETRRELELAQAQLQEQQSRVAREYQQELHDWYQQQIDLTQEEQINITNGYVTAPIAGVVAQISKHEGEVITQGEEFITLYNPEEEWVEVYLSQGDVAHISVGDEVKVDIKDQGDDTYTAEILRIGNIFTEPISSNNGNPPKIQLIISVPQTMKEKLVPGMAVDVIIQK